MTRNDSDMENDELMKAFENKDDQRDLFAGAEVLGEEAEGVAEDQLTELADDIPAEVAPEKPFDMDDPEVMEALKAKQEKTQFDRVLISIASPDTIRSWSCGEVKNSETINYRTYKPEEGGLFCQKIFGPVKDWECACGKYKRIKNRGVVCDRCGVTVDQAKVRRTRMGHIELECAVAHIWFVKTLPSRIGNLLDMKVSDLEKVLSFSAFAVINPGKCNLRKGQVLNADEYTKASKEGGEEFCAQTGAEALETLLKALDLDALSKELSARLLTNKGERKKTARRLKIVEGFRKSKIQPEFMILHALPVLPPDLRPLVPLDGGRFATSDLNELYRKVINRNNRLRELKAKKITPEIIINNEKRMLQAAVDALIDNARLGKHAAKGPGNRELKSLSDNLKGKQGRFRQNLLGKRVDYSGRSVIVVGPELKMTQCGLPKKMALQLFEPFVMREMLRKNIAATPKCAKKYIEESNDVVWDILDEVTQGRVVLLNRAPTLHRLGIQAFEPVLIEGNSIRVHPLVCGGFNADFDGDQMAVHVPLSKEALWEAKHYMMAPTNLFSPASGKAMMMPTQEIVLGIYYLTHDAWLKEHESSPCGVLTPDEVHRAFDCGAISLHHKIQVLLAPGWKPVPANWERSLEGKSEEIVETTAGRIFFNELLPVEMAYVNETVDKKGLSNLIMACFNAMSECEAKFGPGAKDKKEMVVEMLDRVKAAGFHESTIAGFSISTSDMMVPSIRENELAKTQKAVDELAKKHAEGKLSEKDRYNQAIKLWNDTASKLSETLYGSLQDRAEELRELNPLHMMVDSGARGSRDQIKQLAGMRGLMANPEGGIIEMPIKSNFKEGLSMLEYFISSHGARKGLADTALKTADAGYLTRRLVDVAHDIIITEQDCHTPKGIDVSAIKEGSKVVVSLAKRLLGRTPLQDVYGPAGELLAKAGEIITAAVAKQIDDSGVESVTIRSVMTCEAARGVCAKCYGMDLSKYELVSEGTPVGIIAAQSIGEPGTQLTMRTFHIGGTANVKENEKIKARMDGVLSFENVNHAQTSENRDVVLSNGGTVVIKDAKGNKLWESDTLKEHTILLKKAGDKVKKGDDIAEEDPLNTAIYARRTGTLVLRDVEPGKTMMTKVNEITGEPETAIDKYEERDAEHKNYEKSAQRKEGWRPVFQIVEDLRLKDVETIIREGGVEKLGKDWQALMDGTTLALSQTELEKIDNEGAKMGSRSRKSGSKDRKERVRLVVAIREVKKGELLGKGPQLSSETSDITSGLPRVEELFEARCPDAANKAVIASISGFVSFPSDDEAAGGRRENRDILITGPEGRNVIVHIPASKTLIVDTGAYVNVGDRLTAGAVDPHELLDHCGTRELQEFLLNQVRGVYQSQGVEINDKHIEVIVRQMLRKVRITDAGDTDFLFDDEVERSLFDRANREAVKAGKRPANGQPLLQGITKASLSTTSFISAASFQHTTSVLTEAASRGGEDKLRGFKENIIMGHLVPSGKGFNKERLLGEAENEITFDMGYTASHKDSEFLLEDEDERDRNTGFQELEDMLGAGGSGSDAE